jgi:hypothetical protein
MERGVDGDEGRTGFGDHGQDLVIRKEVPRSSFGSAEEAEARGPLRRAGQVQADDDRGFSAHACP